MKICRICYRPASEIRKTCRCGGKLIHNNLQSNEARGINKVIRRQRFLAGK